MHRMWFLLPFFQQGFRLPQKSVPIHDTTALYSTVAPTLGATRLFHELRVIQIALLKDTLVQSMGK